MRNLKKVLGLVLCLAMMLSIMVVGAGAAFADQSDIDTKHQEAVDMCNTLNIITGFENGKFMPKDNVTREQMAKMICVLDNGGKEPQLATGSTFSDVAADRWSNKYIEACASRGVVVGIGGGKFSPAGKVTATQAAKMLLVELGYDDDNQQYSGANWATKVNVDATAKGYYVDLEDIDVNAPLTREHAAQMIWNALKANEVEYTNQFTTDANGNLVATPKVQDKITSYEYGTNIPRYLTLLADKYGVVDNEGGQMIGFSYDSNKGEWTYRFASNYNNNNLLGGSNGGGKFADFSATGSIKSTTDYTGLLGQNVRVIYTMDKSRNFDKIYGMYADESVVLTTGIVGDIDDESVKNNEVKIDSTTYKTDQSNSKITPVAYFAGNQGNVDAALPTTLNALVGAFTAAGAGDTPTNAAGLIATGYSYLRPMDVKAIDNDDDGKIDLFIVSPVVVGQVTYVGSKSFTFDTFDNVLNKDNRYNFEDVTAYDGVAEDDFVIITPKVYSNVEEDTIVKADTVLAGTVTSVNGAQTKAAVDGTWYSLMPRLTGGNAPSAKDDIKDAPVVNGYMYAADTSGGKDVEDYAVVIGYDIPGNGNTIDDVRVKLLLSDGSKVTGTAANYNPATGEKYASEAAYKAAIPSLNNCLVTFEKNSDDEYELTPVAATATGSGFKEYIASTTVGSGPSTVLVPEVQAKSSSGTKVTYISGANIKDDAVIFLNDAGSYKVISGEKLKTLSMGAIGNWTQPAVARAFGEKDSNGYLSVEMAYLSVGAKAVQADKTYAYVTQDPVTAANSDGKTVWMYEAAWTESGAQDLYTSTKSVGDATDASGNKVSKVAKGDVIEVEQNDKGEVTGITVIGRTKDVASSPQAPQGAPAAMVATAKAASGVVALTAYDGTYMSIWNRDYPVTNWADGSTAGNDSRFEITKDTVILYVDGANFAGVEGSTSNIRTAASTGKDSGGNNIGHYYNAVSVIDIVDNEVDLLVMDVNNDILDKNN